MTGPGSQAARPCRVVRTIGACAVIAGICTLVYAGSFRGVFLFDDIPMIAENAALRSPLPAIEGTSRPLTNLTFHLNFRWGALDPRGYHAVNLGIHTVAACLLYLLSRRTLSLPALPPTVNSASSPIALLSAILWAVHPLQTESVTYVVQRAESLMGMLYLGTLFAAVVGTQAGAAGSRWHTAAVVLCALGMTAKPAMVTAPVCVLLYDRFFLAGSFAGAWRARRGLYAGLAATWIVPAALLSAPNESLTSAGFAAGIGSPLAYLKSQMGAHLLYLRLAVWPVGLCLDYDWPRVVSPAQYAPQAMALAGILSAIGCLGRRRHPLGFAGCFYFLVLLPSSSVIPVADAVAEHRLYLPLAAVAVPVAVALWYLPAALARRLGAAEPAARLAAHGPATAIAAALAVGTVDRNGDYASAERMWASVLEVRPGNLRALFGVGAASFSSGSLAGAKSCFERVLASMPDRETARAKDLLTLYAMVHNNLGVIADREGRLAEAESHFREALRVSRSYAAARKNLAIVVGKRERLR